MLYLFYLCEGDFVMGKIGSWYIGIAAEAFAAAQS
jgi:hypothetical protein